MFGLDVLTTYNTTHLTRYLIPTIARRLHNLDSRQGKASQLEVLSRCLSFLYVQQTFDGEFRGLFYSLWYSHPPVGISEVIKSCPVNEDACFKW